MTTLVPGFPYSFALLGDCAITNNNGIISFLARIEIAAQHTFG